MGERGQAGEEGVGRAALRPAESLAGDRLHGGEDVLDPMLQLAHQHMLQPFGRLPLGDVARDLGGADDPAVLVANRRHGERNVDQPAVLVTTLGLVRLDALAFAYAGDDRGFLVGPVRRHQEGHRQAEHLLGRIAIEMRRAIVPARHPHIEIGAEDGIVGGGDDGGEPPLQRLGPPPVGYVEDDGARLTDAARLVAHGAERIGDPDERSVLADQALLDRDALASLQQLVELGDRRRQVVAKGDVLHPQPEQLRLGAPGDLAEPVIDHREAAIEIDQRDAARRLAEQGAQPRLALLQGVLCRDARRRLADDAEHGLHDARMVANGRVGDVEIDVFRKTVPLDVEAPVLGGDRLAGGANMLEQRLQVGPELAPVFAGRPAERMGMLVADRRRVGVVVDGDELGTGKDDDLRLRRQNQIHGSVETFRPRGARPERAAAPIERADQAFQFPAGVICQRGVHVQESARNVRHPLLPWNGREHTTLALNG